MLPAHVFVNLGVLVLLSLLVRDMTDLLRLILSRPSWGLVAVVVIEAVSFMKTQGCFTLFLFYRGAFGVGGCLEYNVRYQLGSLLFAGQLQNCVGLHSSVAHDTWLKLYLDCALN